MVRIESKFVSDTVRVALTQVLVLVLNLLLLRLVQGWIGSDGLARFLVARRILVVLAPLLLLGLDVALTRAVALDPRAGGSLLGLGLLFLTAVSATALLLGFAGRDLGGAFAFGHQEASALFLATVFFSISYAFLTLWYAVLRGHQRMGVANGLQVAYLLIEISVLALVVVVPVLRAKPIESLLGLSGLGVLGITLAGAIRDGAAISVDRERLVALLRYGLPRVPSIFLLSANLTIPVLLASHLVSLRAAGLIAVGTTIITATETVTVAVSTMLLPKLAAMTLPGRQPELRRGVNAALTFSAHIGLLASFVLPGVIGPAVTFWLGPDYRSGMALIALAVVGTGPYLVYTILRNVLNAISEIPVVTVLTGVGAGITLLSSLLFQSLGPFALAWSLVAGLLLLGLGSALSVVWIGRVSLDRKEWWILAAILGAGVVLLAGDALIGRLAGHWALPLRLSSRVLFVALIGTMLWRGQTAWCAELAVRTRGWRSGSR